jgi:GTP-binding protein
MIIKNSRYEVTAVKPDQYPKTIIPEIAFVGRSNVGKSSIINTLLSRKNLARVGATPGKTRQVNFYNVDERFYFVDLPGYGYASVSKTEKSSWGNIIETYLSTRKQLKLVIMLVDIRHTPSKDDKLMHDWIMSYNMPYIIVAAKADKISRAQINLKLKDIRGELGLTGDIKLIAFSSETRQGKEEILEAVSCSITDSE